jgi:hypothetical protein
MNDQPTIDSSIAFAKLVSQLTQNLLTRTWPHPPVALVAIIGMTWCCWIGRAKKAELQIHGQLKSLVAEKMRQGDLNINLENSVYDQVRVLLDVKTST